MGNCGYRILLWDSWGGGLVMVNPRFLAEGEDLYGNPNNWWSCDEEITDEEIIKKHKLTEQTHYFILYDEVLI